jgi:hypothetical protein
MARCVKDCLLGMTAAVLLVLTMNGSAKAASSQYHIPDDCLGTWKYCYTFRLKHFTDYGPYFTDDRRFLPSTIPPDLDDPFPSQIQPLSPAAGDPSDSLRQ